MVKKMFFGVILIGLNVLILTSCGFNSQKNEGKDAATTGTVISEELHQAHCDLLAKANEELAGINQKVRALNDKIRDKGVQFTDAQNLALDDFELKQGSINKRMHEIKNVKQEDWENFKTTFEKDLQEIHAAIDDIISEL